ncbi:disulfide bond formation protein B [Burkholderia dolosa]|uniref:Disulfide bond formation protein B n=2 Tax=Burkholderiaceae TaxID=119060 RepID=A0A892IIV0_9BURK|nr:disulfide bond formation DsbB family protein [Burkholderia dolosa AU0158]AKE01960.1 disulfide bond formation protein [Burkholderia cepacia]AYZ95614.1 disulfide bond formation protein B [Burkholderia dolosa]PRE51068.1 disulfide bond formation protein B [Burkholderia sp. AU12872]PUA75410.1 disulfide bond formation protein B [Burkholderia sp. AU29985]
MNARITRERMESLISPDRSLNALALLGIDAALLLAFYYQLVLHELPCPLCLLQRAGLILIGLGFTLNIHFGARATHYGLVVVSAIATGAVALRQVLLHIAPGTGSYGSTLWGFHFYTWAAIAASLTVLYVAALLALRRVDATPARGVGKIFNHVAVAVFAILIVANLASTLLECGVGQCDDNPVRYELLD